MIRRRILLGVLLAVLFTLGWWAGRGRAAGGLYANLDLFVEVLHAVQTNYVDEPDPAHLIEGGLRGMLRALDPSSEFIDAADWKARQAAAGDEFDGTGLYVDSQDGWPVVIAPLEGSPAWRAGLAEGDVITRLDGHSTWGLGPPEMAARLRGAPGSTVVLSVIHGTEAHERELKLTRERFRVAPVRNALVMPDGVGYLRLAAFDERASGQVRAALDTLRRAGARSLVLDLRGNPGGLVEQAVAVAGSFLPAGSVVTFTAGRTSADARQLRTPKGIARVAWPMAVLVDGGTASAAEILAGALQDLDRALVVGSRTYGSGAVQSLFPLRGGEGAVRLTTARYHTPSGRTVSRPAPEAASDDPEAADDEEGPLPSGPDSAAADSAGRPLFRTSAGRTVRGGGGVVPDLVARADSLPPAAGPAAVRVALAADAAFQRAAGVLRRAKNPADVFAFSASESEPAPAPRTRRPAPHAPAGSR